MSTEQYMTEVQGNRVRPLGMNPLWTSEDLFQKNHEGWNLVLPVDYKALPDNDDVFRVQHQIISKHNVSRLDAHKFEHRQIHLPKWLTPYIELVQSHPAARGVYDNKNHKDPRLALSISPTYDLFGNQLQMFIFYQGSVIHNWSNWIKNTFQGSGWDQDNEIPTQSPLAHYGGAGAGISVLDVIEKAGWEHVKNGAFDGVGERGVPDWLWHWQKDKDKNGDDWESTSANPNKHHLKASEMKKDLFGKHLQDGPALVFGQPLDDNERHDAVKMNGGGYSKAGHAMYGGTWHQSIPIGRQWANRFEQYEYNRLGLKRK